jgi:hypothetical protein
LESAHGLSDSIKALGHRSGVRAGVLFSMMSFARSKNETFSASLQQRGQQA